MQNKALKRLILSLTTAVLAISLTIGFFVVFGQDVVASSVPLRDNKPVSVQILTVETREMPIIVEAVGR
jgi:hypothetical protein